MYFQFLPGLLRLHELFECCFASPLLTSDSSYAFIPFLAFPHAMSKGHSRFYKGSSIVTMDRDDSADEVQVQFKICISYNYPSTGNIVLTI